MIPEEAVDAAAKQIIAHLASAESGYVDAEDMSDVVIDVSFDLTSAVRDALEAAFPYLTEPARHQPVTDWPDIPRSRK